jgi:IPT/TIG domain
MKSLAPHRWIRSIVQTWFSPPRKPLRRAKALYRLQIERLEDRVVPSAWLVTNTSNSAGTSGSLPWAVAQADTDTSNANITFDPADFTNATTITLAGTLNLTNTLFSITINGSGAGPISVSGNHAIEVFDIASGVTTGISSLTVANGTVNGNGGGILNNGTLALSNVTVSGNTASSSGGGICNAGGGTLTLSNVTFSGNSASGSGGDIDNAAGAQLSAGSTSAFSSTTSVNDNGVLDLDGYSNSIGTFNGSGSVIDSGAAATLTVSGGGFFSGNITGPNTGLTVAGTNKILTLAGNDTYGGQTAINGGDTLQAGSTTALSASSNVSNAGTLNLQGYSDAIGALQGAGKVTNNLASVTYQIDNGSTGLSFNNSLRFEPEDNWVGNVFTAATGGTQLLSVSFYDSNPNLNGSTLLSPFVTAALYTGAPGTGLTLVPGSVNTVALNATSAQWITVPFATLQYLPVGQVFTAALLIDDVPLGTFPWTEDTSGSSANSYFDVDANAPNGTVNIYNVAAPNNPTPIGSDWGSSGNTNAPVGHTLLRVNYATPAATLTVTGGGIYSGTIQNGSGTVALTVAGASQTLTLSGADTYSGQTTIDNTDTLLVNGSETSPVSVGSGATLGGTGTVAALTVFDGGTANPGSPVNSTGTLTCNNNSNFSNAGNLTVDISGSSNDLFHHPGGFMTLGGTSTLTIDLNGLTSPSGNPITVSDNGYSAEFSAVNVVNNPNGFNVVVAYTSGNITVTIFAAPTVTAVNPATGSNLGGAMVTITGTNFLDATAVSFGSTPATSFTVNSNTQIVAVAPAGAVGTVDVIVTSPAGNSPTSSADHFTFAIHSPTVTSVSPTSGGTNGGTTVTVTGHYFTGATSVMFGSIAATGFTVNSDTQITAFAPAHATGTVNITVTTADGTSPISNADHFTYSVLQPAVTSVSPSSGSTTGGSTVTISGSYFTGATSVKFGSTAATSFTVNSDTQITAVAPAHAAGTVDVTVTTSHGTSATSSSDNFTYFVLVPAVTSVSPNSGSISGESTVTITGSYFTGATAVRFGGTTATSFTVNSDTQITATAPAESVGTVNVTVTTAYGTSATSSSDDFTYVGVSLGFALAMGNTNQSGGTQVTTDAAGNIYTTGDFQGTVNFNPNGSAVNLTSAGGTDIYVAKYSSTGMLDWAKSIGGTGTDLSGPIAVDGSGNVYISCLFNGGSTAPTTPVNLNPGTGTPDYVYGFGSYGSGSGAFVLKLDNSGNFNWADQTNQWAYALAVDSSGNVYTAASFDADLFFYQTYIVGPGDNVLTGAGNCITKIDSNGNFLWGKQFDSANSQGNASPAAIAVDSAGNIYTTGVFDGEVNFNTSGGTFDLTAGSSGSIFVAKLNGSGNLDWAGMMGGTQSSSANAIAVDAAGNVYTTGNFNGTANFNPNGTADLTAPNGDAFVSKLDTYGNYVWAHEIGNNSSTGSGIAVDGSGSVYVTGGFSGTSTCGATTLVSGGSDNIYEATLSSSGSFLNASAFIGTASSSGGAVAVDGAGNIVLTGTFQGTVNFNPGSGTDNLTAPGGGSIYLVKVLQQKQLSFSTSPPNTTTGGAFSVAVNEVDQNNQPVIGATVTIAMSSGTLNGNLTATTDSSGTATFNNLSVSTAGSYTLTASAAGAAGAVTSPFTITAAATLSFATQPVDTVSYAALSPVTVQVEDASDQPVSGAAVNIGISSGTLSGTLTAISNAAGQAVFSDLSVSPAGAYTLTASVAGVTIATSNSFAITPPTSPTVFMVENANIYGPGSFPQAIINANNDVDGSCIIKFDPAVFTSATTIPIAINTQFFTNTTQPVMIDGSGAGPITIDGQGSRLIFKISPGANVTFNNLTVSNGNGNGSTNSTRSGGGFWNNGGKLTIDNSTVSHNMGNNGAGIYNSDFGTLLVENSSLTNNTISQGNGGAIGNFSGAVTVINSNLSDNYGGNSGGAYADNVSGVSSQGGSGTFLLENSTISGNSASAGGGIYISQYPTTIDNCTITGNSCSGGGGGIDENALAFTPLYGILTLQNDIIAGNICTNSNTPDLFIDFGASITANHTLIGNSLGITTTALASIEAGVGNILNVPNPDLGPLDADGGPTQSIPLLTGSPAIGGGGPVTQTNAAIADSTTTSVSITNGQPFSASSLPVLSSGSYFTLQVGGEQMAVTGLTLGSGASSVATAVIDNHGGYMLGDILTVVGGTFTTPAQLRVSSTQNGAILGVNIVNSGSYSVPPTNPVTVTGGNGVGATFLLTYSGGVVTVATVVNGGHGGYAVGDTLTVVGGTGSAATLTVAAASNGTISTFTVSSPGSYSVPPPNSVTVTGGGGSGATFTLSYSSISTLTVVRGIDGTTAAPHGSGASVDLASDQRGFLVPANNPPVVDMGAYQSTGVNDRPTITAVSPNVGSQGGGTTVTITGTNFTGATAVSFGSTEATSFTVGSNTQIIAVDPAETLGTVDITVTTPLGNTAPSTSDQFTYVVAPTVTSLSPTTGPVSGGTSVIITGTGFTNSTAVNFGSTAAASFTINSDTQMTAIAPAGGGIVDVTVTNSYGGTSATASADQFTYIGAAVTGVIPNAGSVAGGTIVIITGTGFTGATAVNFGPINAATYTVNSDTQITATSPSGVGVVDVTVTTPVGGTSAAASADQFTYVAAPTVTGLSPTSGPAIGGTSVIITGMDFTGATAVNFGATNATAITVNSPTQITATAPTGTGIVDVTVTVPVGGTSAILAPDQFTYIAAPTVTSLSPTAGPVSGGTIVTITGTGFTGATAVTFGATNSTVFTINSDTQITATAPPGGGVVDVTVSIPVAGTSATSSADQFTYLGAAVTGVSPTNGPTSGGTIVTITGTGFTGATAVKFGATAATTYTVNSDTQITATSPVGSSSVDVTVTTPVGGTSVTSSADLFTYSLVTSNTANVADSSTTITINGGGFSTTPANNTVAFNLGVVGSVTSATTTQLTVTILTPPMALGSLTAVVAVNGFTIGTPVQVATEVNGTWIVNSSNGGAGTTLAPMTLAFAVTHALSGDQITFASGLSGSTITLDNVMTISANITITGLGAANLAVSGGNAHEVFSVNSGVTASISGLTIENGLAKSGGGIFNHGTLTLTNDDVSNNSATSYTFYVQGGGIFNSGTLTISASTITGNTTFSDGGGIYNTGTLTMSNSTVFGNAAYTAGGGIDAASGTVTLTDCTVAGNHGWNNNGSLPTEGGGIFRGGAATLNMNNTIVANNITAGLGPQIYGTIASANYCLIGSTSGNSISSGANNLLNVSAGLASSLAYNGGPTQTLALLPGSAAIGAGAPSQAGTTAQNGLIRPMPPDIGAYQSPPSVTPSNASLPLNASSITIAGFGFDPIAIHDSVTFDNGVTGTVTAATSTTLTVSLTGISSLPVGTALDASATVDGVSTGSPVQVATIAPAVTASTANLPVNATSMTIAGFGFDPIATNDSVTFDNGVTGSVTAATTTSLTVNLTGLSTLTGGKALHATVTVNGTSSGSPVQVATVAPVVTASSAGLADNATSMTIAGFGFDTNIAHDSVTFDNGVTGSVTAATGTHLTVSLTGLSSVPGGTALHASATVNGVSSGSPVKVATVTPVITASSANLPANATSMTIAGFGFDTNNTHDSVTFDHGVTGSVTAATSTSMTVSLTGLGSVTGGTALHASVTVNGTSNGSAVQVATVAPVVTPNSAYLPVTATSLTIAGIAFDATAAHDSVTFDNGVTGSVTAASSTSLIVSLTGLSSLPGGTALHASVTVNGVSSGSAVHVATVDAITTQPTSVLVNATQNASFTATTSGASDSVQWQVDSGSGFTNLSDTGYYSGSTTTTLTITGADASLNLDQYRAIFTNVAGTLMTNAATLTVDSITAQPSSEQISAGQNASFTAATSNPSDTVQWQVNLGSGFTNLIEGGYYSGTSTTTLTITGADVTLDGAQYQAVFTNSAGTVTTNAATLTVTVAATTTTLIDNGPNPSNFGDAVSFTATVSGGTTINGETVYIEDASNANAVVASPTLSGNTVTFTISNLSVGTHNLFAVYNGDDNNTGSNSSATPVSQVVDNTAPVPVFESIEVNGGAPQYLDQNGLNVSLSGQNSVVEQILVTFNEPVTLDPGAFSVVADIPVTVNSGPNPNTVAPDLNAPIQVGDGHQWIITFSNSAGTTSNENGYYVIKDGVYSVHIDHTKVHANSQNMATDVGGPGASAFWALYGDTTFHDISGVDHPGYIGDGYSDVSVGNGDFVGFKACYNSDSSNYYAPPNYNVKFDANLDGSVANSDFVQFKANYNADWQF